MKKVLIVCEGNTCRSPMAKVILEQMLRERGLESEITVDSAAKGRPTLPTATKNAREAIKDLYERDLLANHRSKSKNNVNLNDFQLILTMEENHKHGLLKDVTFTLKEYAGLKGKIRDPYGKNLEEYKKYRDEIKNCLEQVIKRFVQNC